MSRDKNTSKTSDKSSKQKDVSKESKKLEKEDKAPTKKNDKQDKSKDVESRKSKYADVDKGDSPNKATAFAKLYFNVKSTQKWLVEYYKRYTIDRKKKDEDKGDDNRVKILNAHFALTAADQVICLSLVNLAADKSKKAAAGLYTITEENMIDNIKLDKDFNYTFLRFLDMYSPQENYAPQMGLTKDTVMKFIETYAFSGGNSNVNLDNQAFNVLMYIMLKNRIMLAENAFQMTSYAHKSSVDDRAIMYSLKTVYTGQLLQRMHKKVEDVSRRVRGIKAEKEESEEAPQKKGSKEKKPAKKGKSKDDSDSEEDEKNDSNSESDESESEDSDSE